VFLLVPAYMGCSGPKAIKQLCVCITMICVAPSGCNFRGDGAWQRVSEQRKKRKPGKRGMSLA